MHNDTNKIRIRHQSGFSLIEFLIVFAILIMAVGIVVTVQKDLFSFNKFFSESFLAQNDASIVIAALVAEIRTASQSSVGGYPIEIAGNNSLAFYANIDSDTLKERVHYFLNGASLMKSVVKPVGQPLTYSTTTASENLRPVLRDVVSSSTAPLFSHYDSSYAGTTTPLVQPVNIIAIRHIGIQISVDASPGVPPPAITVASKVTIRNLKDNQ